jgi:hypothetical protein
LYISDFWNFGIAAKDQAHDALNYHFHFRSARVNLHDDEAYEQIKIRIENENGGYDGKVYLPDPEESRLLALGISLQDVEFIHEKIQYYLDELNDWYVEKHNKRYANAMYAYPDFQRHVEKNLRRIIAKHSRSAA